MRDNDSKLIWESVQEGCGCPLPVLRQDPKEKLKDLKRRVEAEEELADGTITVSIEKESAEDSGDWKAESITNLIKWFEEYPQMLEVAKESNDALKQIAQNAIVDHYEVELDDAVDLIESAVNKLSEGDIDWSDDEKKEMFDKATKNETFNKLQRLKGGVVQEHDTGFPHFHPPADGKGRPANRRWPHRPRHSSELDPKLQDASAVGKPIHPLAAKHAEQSKGKGVVNPGISNRLMHARALGQKVGHHPSMNRKPDIPPASWRGIKQPADWDDHTWKMNVRAWELDDQVDQAQKAYRKAFRGNIPQQHPSESQEQYIDRLRSTIGDKLGNWWLRRW